MPTVDTYTDSVFWNFLNRITLLSHIIQKILSRVLIQIQSQADSNVSPILIHTDRILKLQKRKDRLCQPSTSSSNNDQQTSTNNSPEIKPSGKQKTRIIKPSTIDNPAQRAHILRPCNAKKFKHNSDYVYYKPLIFLVEQNFTFAQRCTFGQMVRMYWL